MKRFSILSCVILLLAAALAVGSATFLGPCVHEDGSFGSCHWAGQALLGVGCAVALQALLAMASRHRAGMFLGMIPTALLGLFLPGTLVALCRMDTMRCRAVMRPASAVLCGAILLLALAGALIESRKGK